MRERGGCGRRDVEKRLYKGRDMRPDRVIPNRRTHNTHAHGVRFDSFERGTQPSNDYEYDSISANVGVINNHRK